MLGNKKSIRERAKQRQNLISKTYEPYFPAGLKQKKFNKLGLSSRKMDRSFVESVKGDSKNIDKQEKGKTNRYRSVKTRSPKKRTPQSKLSSVKNITKVDTSSTLLEIKNEKENKKVEESKIKTNGHSEIRREKVNDMMAQRKQNSMTVKKKKTQRATGVKLGGLSMEKSSKTQPPRYTQALKREEDNRPLPEITPTHKKKRTKKEKTAEQLERDDYVQALLEKNAHVMHVDSADFMKKSHKYKLPHLNTDKRLKGSKGKSALTKEKSKSSPAKLKS